MGICFNKTADKLAKEALDKDYIDSETNLSLWIIKGIMMNRWKENCNCNVGGENVPGNKGHMAL